MAVWGRVVPWAESSRNSDLLVCTGQGPGQHGDSRVRGTEPVRSHVCVTKPQKGQGPDPVSPEWISKQLGRKRGSGKLIVNVSSKVTVSQF